MQDYFGFALFCSVIDIENFLNHLVSFDTAILSPASSSFFSFAFVGCYDYFSFGFTPLNQSALNLIFLKLCPL